MQKDIHPKYDAVEVTCACGNIFTTKSCKCENKTMRVEICSNCHPFYTGKQKIVDSAGRVERFKKKYQTK